MPDRGLLRLEASLSAAWRKLYDCQSAASECGFETARQAIADMIWQVTEIQRDCVGHRKGKWRPAPTQLRIDFPVPPKDPPDIPF